MKRAKIGDRDLGVCEQFVSDFNRSKFTTAGQPLLNSQESGTRRINEGVSRLATLLGGDRDLVFAVSQYANQASFGPVMDLTVRPDSMIRLQDGSAGVIAQNFHNGSISSYDIVRTDDGEARIQFQVTITGQQFFARNGGSHWLAPDAGEVSFAFELTVNRNGSARLTQPLTYDLNLRADDQWSDDIPYARPNPDDVESVLSSSASDVLKRELYEFAQRTYAEENIDFYNAVQEYRKAPSAEAARALFDTFVAPDSDRQVNLSHEVVSSVRNAIAGGQVDAFDAAIPETQQNIAHTLRQFVNEKQRSI